MSRFTSFPSQLVRSRSGVAMTEFALSLPLLLMVGLGGAETANLSLAHMKVGQLAVHLADNASRVGDTTAIVDRKIFEEDINDIIVGSNIDGRGLYFYERGRAIISSLEVWDQSVHCRKAGRCPGSEQAAGVQFINWQRCMGKLAVNSSYGVQNQALPGGMGPTGSKISALPDTGVIFVEVVYQYKPLFSSRIFGPTTIRSTAVAMVRDKRDLSQLYKRNVATPPAGCGAGTYVGVPHVTV